MQTNKEFKRVKELVEFLLANDIRCRNDDKWLTYRVMRYFTPIYIPFSDFSKIPAFETIKRCRAKIQNEEGRYLPTDPGVIAKRRIRAEFVRSWSKGSFNGGVSDMDWQKVKSESSNWFKLASGETALLQFLDEPKQRTNQYNKLQWVCHIRVDGKEYLWGCSNSLMQKIGKLLGFPEFITGRKILLSREGTTKENTKYSVDLPKSPEQLAERVVR